MIRPLLVLAACVGLSGCITEDGLRAKSFLRLQGFTDVKLEVQGFRCVVSGEPRVFETNDFWAAPRNGYFFTARQGAKAVRGSVCVPATERRGQTSSFKLLP